MQRREKGTGTIYQRDNGTWVGRISLGRGADGKLRYKCFSGKNEAVVKRKIREYNKGGIQQVWTGSTSEVPVRTFHQTV